MQSGSLNAIHIGYSKSADIGRNVRFRKMRKKKPSKKREPAEKYEDGTTRKRAIEKSG